MWFSIVQISCCILDYLSDAMYVKCHIIQIACYTVTVALFITSLCVAMQRATYDVFV